MQESGEMYLETIYVLGKSNGNVRSIDIAEKMGFSKPSVSRGVGILKRDGYISIDDNGYISLTDFGKALAEKIYERHTVLTELLIKLGVDEETAQADACKIEHVISDETMVAIKNSLK